MTLTDEKKLTLFRTLLRASRMDEYARDCLRQGAIKLFWHSSAGMEAVGVGGASMLAPDDYVWYHYRGHGLPYLLGRGGDPRPLFAEHFGKASGCAQGRSGYHVVAPEVGIFGFFGFLGAGLGVATGYGMSAQHRGAGQAVLCGLGDGTANRGNIHESLNLAALRKLPVVYLCENNGYVVYTPRSSTYAGPSGDYKELVESYGIPARVVDGQDVFAVAEAVAEALERARAGYGPAFIEAKTFRYRPHSEGQADLTLAAKREVQGLDRDPLRLARERLAREELLGDEEFAAMEQEVAAEIAEIDRFARSAPDMVPTVESLRAATYAD
ncbi:thiamine pyrophosphate-dependent dehydrogenase E1 component subunit alpha [Streptomyces sp. NPDC056716]|uniref:thiamine pyrophosphate-dependent dehydrogenase E1 component subunit alpha n=1 Tax=unclassified Streptomyces TaxID=2593676 RepID=UPI0036BB62A1